MTELMRHVGEDKGHRAANGFLAIGDHAFHCYLPWLQHPLDFGQQGRQIALREARATDAPAKFLRTGSRAPPRGPRARHPVASRRGPGSPVLASATAL